MAHEVPLACKMGRFQESFGCRCQTFRKKPRLNGPTKRLSSRLRRKNGDWDIFGLKKKLKASEDTLAEERRKWRKACKKDNENMYSSRNEITNLKAQAGVSAKTIAELSTQDEDLTKSKADMEEWFEAAKVHREHMEQNQVRSFYLCSTRE
ncbi:hypothetical protein Hanom_Chr07g00645101 [Helianthus anomalus]